MLMHNIHLLYTNKFIRGCWNSPYPANLNILDGACMQIVWNIVLPRWVISLFVYIVWTMAHSEGEGQRTCVTPKFFATPFSFCPPPCIPSSKRLPPQTNIKELLGLYMYTNYNIYKYNDALYFCLFQTKSCLYCFLAYSLWSGRTGWKSQIKSLSDPLFLAVA